ncbi:hypothetical protein COV81_05170 [Candidatus Peregrinibacteria bacterium CG11_big_fil_rev_8_21_14_0_20_41_10]|nr:MAG: hypothetical protein COV81_05170 [Candidatus Peregrinibacteria bacterium CG11_big_fil_rev_8_21_14_0_20_41_10]PIZ76909.1 MAG: hypothetical protein COY06_01165 [Candidatus Peregrinibacteria bacterium CG_4_10_14_0_2_um_filter_41_8]PJC37815.1 MAG: hypothetical protein CO045_03545 [Candidatus Peregrinibacteria bacterium CG_4_9_14_0_2_um_filter_41_14]
MLIQFGKRKIEFSFVEFVFFGILILLPLVFDYWGFDIYEVTKNVVLRFGIGLLLVGYGIKILFDKKFKWYGSKKIYYWLVAFLVVIGLSLLTSVHPLTSFVGSYYRQAGVVNFLLFVLLFLFGLQILAVKKNKSRLIAVISYTGVIVAIYAILQKFGIDVFVKESVEIFGGRSFSFMGNPTSLGAYLIFPFWTLILQIKDNWKSKVWVGGYAVAFGLVSLALYYTQNRSTVLAILIVGLLVIAYYLRKYWKLLLGLFVAACVLLAGFVSYYDSDLRSLNSRLVIWESSLNIVKHQPILGTGAESFAVRFENYVLPNFFKYEDYYNLVDRPHNEPLEWWINFGILGLGFYLALFALLVTCFWQSRDQKVKFMIAVVITLFVSNWFSFSWTVHYVMLAVTLAYVFVGLTKGVKLKRLKYGAIVAVLLGIGMLIWGGTLIVVNHKLSSAVMALSVNDIEGVVADTEDAVKLAPYYLGVSIAAFNNYYVLAPVLGSSDYFARAIELNEKAKLQSGYDLRSLLNEVRLALELKEYSVAENLLAEIYELKAPNPVVYQVWGDMYFEQQDFAKAAEVYQELLGLLPDVWQAPVLGNEALTDEQRIFWKNHSDFADLLDRIVFSYVAVGKEQEAKEILEKLK